MTRNIQPAIALIKRFEGLADGDPSTVNLDPYRCPAGYWTIGWGHVVRDARGRMLKGRARGADARAIFPRGITYLWAERLLFDDVAAFAAALNRVLATDGTDLRLNDNQYCALLSFVFNVGISAFERSTLLQRLREGDFADVPRQLKRWTRGGGRVLGGLKRRREAEAKLWLTQVSVDEIAREKPCPHEAEAKLDHWEATLGAAPDATGDAPSEAVVRLSRGEEWS